MISSRVKKIIIGIVVVAAAVLGGLYFQNDAAPEPASGGLVTSRVDGPVLQETTTGNDEFLATLLSIKGIRIDTSLFNNPAFLFLKNHPVVLGTDIVGRPNPFAPIGSDPAVTNPSSAGTQAKTGAASTAVGIETLQPGKITATSAELGAAATFPGGTGPAVLVFNYGTNQDLTASTESVILENADRVLLPLSGLAPGTKYYVRASLLYGTQALRGSIMTFTTKAL